MCLRDGLYTRIQNCHFFFICHLLPLSTVGSRIKVAAVSDCIISSANLFRPPKPPLPPLRCQRGYCFNPVFCGSWRTRTHHSPHTRSHPITRRVFKPHGFSRTLECPPPRPTHPHPTDWLSQAACSTALPYNSALQMHEHDLPSLSLPLESIHTHALPPYKYGVIPGSYLYRA